MTTTRPAVITSLDQLSTREPTVISPTTDFRIDGCYPDFDGNTYSRIAKGGPLHAPAPRDRGTTS